MTGYVRKDTTNNIADGNVINAADLDSEFDGVQAAFNSSTGHTHDGSSAEGAPITKLGPVQDVTISTTVLGVKTTNTVDLGTSSLKFKDFYLAGAASIGGALTYGGVTLSNAVTGTGNMVLSASPTLTGTITAAAANFSGAVAFNGTTTIGDADTDTITQTASYVTGTQLKSAKTATNTLSLAAYDVDGTSYTNLITLTASNTPTLALTSTGVGSMNNITVGATTPSTGAFTTLTTSSTVTHNGGTANGVAYLNGSKALTTGSALVFDGQTLTNTRDTPILLLNDSAASNSALRLLSTGGISYIQSGISGGAFASLAFTANGGGSEQMRLTSTGLGIGESSPSSKLTVASIGATIELKQNATGSATYYVMDNTVETGGKRWRFGYTGAAGVSLFSLYNQTDNVLAWAADSSGNLGLGVTPSANLGVRTLTVADQGGTLNALTLGARTGNYGDIGYGFGFNGSAYKYLINDFASKIGFSQGGVQFFTAPSGTAGNAITFTQAMTLDASGNLGVGATSPSTFSAYTKLSVVNGIAVGVDSSNAGRIVGSTTTGTELSYLTMGGNYNLGSTGEIALATTTAKSILFGTNGTERARIDSSGNFLVGATSSVGAGALGVQWSKDSNGGYGYIRSNLTTSYSHIVFYNPNGAVGSISTSGSSTTYATSSDYRLKDNVQPMTGALEKVAALKPVTYKWKVDGSDGEGFIAHELAEVCPDAVHGEKDGVDEDNNPVYQAIDTSFLVATLTAAIQELKAIVDAQAVEIAALKG